MDQVFIRSHTESAVHQACRFPATGQAQPCERGSGPREMRPLRAGSPHRELCHVGASPVDRDDQAALAEQYRGAPHGVIGDSTVAG